MSEPASTTMDSSAPIDGGVTLDAATPPDASAPMDSPDAAAIDSGTPSPSPSLWNAEPSGTTVSLTAIWGSAANDIYVVGNNGTILHSDGSGTWTAQASGSTATLHAIWGSGPDDVHVVGGGGVHLTSPGDGTWQPAANPAGAQHLSGVWGTSSANYYLIGDGTISHTTDAGLSWTTFDFNQPASDIVTSFIGVWGDGTGRVWVVGNDTNTRAVDVNYSGTRRYSSDDGASWITEDWGGLSVYLCIWGGSIGMSIPSFPAFTESGAMEYINWVTAIWGFGDDQFQATAYGNLIHSKGGGLWVEEPHGTPQPLSGLWGSSATDVYAVGAGGLILHRQ